MNELLCPLDREQIIEKDEMLICSSCKTTFPFEIIGDRKVPDFRCTNNLSEIILTFTIPLNPIPTGHVDRFGKATAAEFKCMSREEIRKKYGTKLSKEFLYYIDLLRKTVGVDARILDLGCGNGGNKKYLTSLGFRNVISVDYSSLGAEYLVDVHRMPFASETFDLILTTATIEHFYHPYIAFNEMSRVLKTNGMLLASASFWESWHGNSCFHLTPSGIDLLCQYASLRLEDLWSGWGFIPSVSTHALKLGKIKRFTYKFQRIFDFILASITNEKTLKIHTFSTSGSFGMFAIKL